MRNDVRPCSRSHSTDRRISIVLRPAGARISSSARSRETLRPLRILAFARLIVTRTPVQCRFNRESRASTFDRTAWIIARGRLRISDELTVGTKDRLADRRSRTWRMARERAAPANSVRERLLEYGLVGALLERVASG